MRALNYALLPVLAVAALSCGGDALTGPNGSLQAQGALAFVGSLNNNLPGMPQQNGMPSVGSIGGLPNGAITTHGTGPIIMSAGLGCETISGVLTDADGDGIDVNRTVTYNCGSYVNGADTYSIAGTVAVLDKKDNAGAAGKGLLGGYHIDIDLLSTHKNATGTNLSYTNKGFFDATASGNSSTFVSQYKTHFTGTQEAYGQVFEINYKYQTDFTVVYTAQTGSTGTVAMSGLIAIDGQFPEQGELLTAKAVMEVRSKGLTYDASCTYMFDQGDIEYVTGSGNVLTVRYNCGASPKFLLDGVELN